MSSAPRRSPRLQRPASPSFLPSLPPLLPARLPLRPSAGDSPRHGGRPVGAGETQGSPTRRVAKGKLEGKIQIPGEPSAPLNKRLWGEGWTQGGGRGQGPGRRGHPGRGRKPVETCTETTERKGKLHQSRTRPLRRRLGGREGGWAGGREELEGGTDGRDRGRGGWGRERGREEVSWWKQRPSIPGPLQSPARQEQLCQGPSCLLLPLEARSSPEDGEGRALAESTGRRT